MKWGDLQVGDKFMELGETYTVVSKDRTFVKLIDDNRPRPTVEYPMPRHEEIDRTVKYRVVRKTVFIEEDPI